MRANVARAQPCAGLSNQRRLSTGIQARAVADQNLPPSGPARSLCHDRRCRSLAGSPCSSRRKVAGPRRRCHDLVANGSPGLEHRRSETQRPSTLAGVTGPHADLDSLREYFVPLSPIESTAPVRRVGIVRPTEAQSDSPATRRSFRHSPVRAGAWHNTTSIQRRHETSDSDISRA